MKKNIFIVLILSTCALLNANSNHFLSKVGILNVNKIVTKYGRDNVSYDELKASYEQQITAVNNEIKSLEAKLELSLSREKEYKMPLNRTDDTQTILAELKAEIELIKKTITIKKQALSKLLKEGNTALKRAQSQRSNKVDREFLRKILVVVSKVAEEHGYTTILKSTDPNLVYNSKQSDITDLVLEEIEKLQIFSEEQN